MITVKFDNLADGIHLNQAYEIRIFTNIASTVK